MGDQSPSHQYNHHLSGHWEENQEATTNPVKQEQQNIQTKLPSHRSRLASRENFVSARTTELHINFVYERSTPQQEQIKQDTK
jgi:hypothetical protein